MSNHSQLFQPEIIEILKSNPSSAKYINDPNFLSICSDISQNPNNILKYQDNSELQQALMTILPIITNKTFIEQSTLQNSSHTAEEEKQIGNDFFSKGDFQTALIHYNQAIKIDPTNIIYYTNRATALTKLGNYSDASEACLRGIDAGLKNNASKSQIAKAYYKLGNSEQLAKNDDAAIFAFEKSLEYQNDPSIMKILEKLKKK